jgi:hypothetical protein
MVIPDRKIVKAATGGKTNAGKAPFGESKNDDDSMNFYRVEEGQGRSILRVLLVQTIRRV